MTIKLKLYKAKDYFCNIIWKYFSIESKECILPSKLYIKKYYSYRMGKSIDLKNPELLSEKINWLKIYYHDPLITICADKYRMRNFVKLKLGEGFTPKILGKWDNANDINFSSLPNQFVLKTNHDDNPIICTDKSNFDFTEAVKTLNIKLKTSKYAKGREWGYKNIKRCVFAEELIGDGTSDLIDYKFFCFNGEPKYLYTVSEHTSAKNGCLDFFDINFCCLPFKQEKYNNATVCPKKPEKLDQMIEFSKKLSVFSDVCFPFVRVDFYENGDNIYVGELTFYPTNGMIKYTPPEWNSIIGSFLELPQNKIYKSRNKEAKKWIRNTLSLDL